MTVCFTLSGGHVVVVDDEDAHLLTERRWHVGRARQQANRFYVKGRTTTATLYLHRMILSAQSGQLVDHVNGDPLDNRRCNLRLASRSLNNVNRKDYAPASGFRGVYFAPKRGTRCWYARITVNGKTIRLGRYASREEAARAYDAAAQKHFGEFAVLNFARMSA